jgi:Domain of unknown function (DUF4349)
MSDLVQELRLARPRAPEALRERVLATAARTPQAAPPRTWPRLRVRRAMLVLAPAAVAVGVGAAVVHGLVSSGRESTTALQRGEATHPKVVGAGRSGGSRQSFATAPRLLGALSDRQRAVGAPVRALPPSRARLQDYRAFLRIRLDDVDGLSSATVRAMRTARRLGGYVVSVRYATPETRHGDAYLTLRVPVGHVQEALMRFSGLGKVVGQDVQIRDVQGGVDALERRMARLRARIDAVDAELRSAGLTAGERRRLERRREGLVSTLQAVARRRAATIRHARFATFTLTLTTGEPQQQPAAPPGRFERTLDDAAGVLVAEAAWTLYVLAVVLPLAALLALALWGARAGRRLADRRLLGNA